MKSVKTLKISDIMSNTLCEYRLNVCPIFVHTMTLKLASEKAKSAVHYLHISNQ